MKFVNLSLIGQGFQGSSALIWYQKRYDRASTSLFRAVGKWEILRKCLLVVSKHPVTILTLSLTPYGLFLIEFKL